MSSEGVEWSDARISNTRAVKNLSGTGAHITQSCNPILALTTGICKWPEMHTQHMLLIRSVAFLYRVVVCHLWSCEVLTRVTILKPYEISLRLVLDLSPAVGEKQDRTYVLVYLSITPSDLSMMLVWTYSVNPFLLPFVTFCPVLSDNHS